MKILIQFIVCTALLIPTWASAGDNKDPKVAPIKECVFTKNCWKEKKVPPMCRITPQGYLVCYPIDLLPGEEELDQ